MTMEDLINKEGFYKTFDEETVLAAIKQERNTKLQYVGEQTYENCLVAIKEFSKFTESLYRNHSQKLKNK